ncbi:MAG TPA: arginine--tRNA ligase [Actinomycetota bacterium]
MIRDRLAAAVRTAALAVAGDALPEGMPAILVERPARKEHGDWSANAAMMLAKPLGRPPRAIAQQIVDALEPMPEVGRVEIAGPGFINFTLTADWLAGVVRDIEQAGPAWGRHREPDGESVNVEFVSANPTGPLHVGHARWAALGDALAAMLEAAGSVVTREFYVNDYGRQMDLFGASIAARYLTLFGRAAEVPEGGYQGLYVTDLAEQIKGADGDRYLEMDDDERGKLFREIGRERMLAHQREVLERFGVRFDVWFSETALHESGAVERALQRLRDGGHTYEQDDALWLRSTDFGDDKDRVVRRGDGTTTYLAPDVAYYLDKRSRGFDRLVYLWGADHHGYVPRMRAVVQALGDEPETVEFLIGQIVNLFRGGEPVRMSKRTGELVTTDELIDEVGVDAARYTLLRQSADTQIDFDIELVVRQSQDNPVFYVQYAHARIASIGRHAAEQGAGRGSVEDADLSLLRHEAEQDLLRKIAELPEIVELAARRRAPHLLPRYAEEVAAHFHSFYRDCRVVTDDAALTDARLHLCEATRITLANTLALLGVSAPERMDRIEENE